MPIGDKFNRASNGTAPVATTLAAPKANGATTASLTLATGWPTTTAVHFMIYSVSVTGAEVANTRTLWKATLSGTSLSNMQLKSGTEPASGYAIGDVVEPAPTSAWADDIVTGLLVEHAQDGTHALGSTSTVTSSKFVTAMNDTNGNELFKLSPTASAVNEFTVTNAATGNAPQLSATGGDTNIDLKLTPKGTGRVVLNGAGALQTATVATSETTTSTSFADLTTTTDTVTATIGASGNALVFISARLNNNTSAEGAFVGFAVSGATTLAAADARSLEMRNSTGAPDTQATWMYPATGLTAGSTTFKLKYRVTSGTGTFSNRNITVLPL